MRQKTALILALSTFVVAPLAAGVLGPAAASGQTTLRWDFRPDQQLALRFEQKSTAKTSLGGGSLEMSLDMTMELDWTVKLVRENGSAEISQAIRRVTLTMQPAGGAVVEYDSESETQDSEAAERIAEAIGPLLDAPMLVVMAASGEIQEVKLPENVEQAAENQPTSPTFATKVSPAEIKQLLGQAGAVFPQKPLEAGEKWSQTRQVTSPLGQLKLVTDYAYEGPHPEGGEKIVTATRLELPAKSSLRIREQRQQGELRFDAQAGRLIGSQVTQLLKTEATSGAKVQTEAESTLVLKVEPK